MPNPRPIRTLAMAAFGLAAAFALAAGAPTSARPAAPRLATTGQNPWLVQVAVPPLGSHIIGNPDAKVKLVEYMSYTCPHCAVFEAEAAPTLRLKFIASGKGSLEIRHLLRDPLDLSVALLVNCGKPARFWDLHHAFLARQGTWLTAAQNTTPAQQARWSAASLGQRMRAIASDLHFYDIMENNGIGRTAADRCLGDAALARRLSAQTAEAAKLGIDGTPSFLVGDTLLAGTHDWASLQPQLDARL